ncbi:hypothetical protein B0H11DRAFT_1990240, partial [Mycena galericulata]
MSEFQFASFLSATLLSALSFPCPRRLCSLILLSTCLLMFSRYFWSVVPIASSFKLRKTRSAIIIRNLPGGGVSEFESA